jgi:RNAse (barnase) inhibitor barstar
MPIAELNGAAIVDAETFHVESARAFGFPDSYTHTMDSWVDCLSYLRDEDGMSTYLHIVVLHSEQLRERAPDVLEEMAFCIIGINERYEDYGEKPALELELR